MKREELLKVFPFIDEIEIQALPSEFVVCWYPSSWNHFNAAIDWREQETKLIPEIFIYTDTSVFEIPHDSEVIFSKEIKGGELRQEIIDEKNDDEKISFERTVLEELEKILLISILDREPDNNSGIVNVTLLKLKDNWFFLVQVENEYLYLSFVEKGIKIDCLYVNRPCDSFLSDRGPDPDQINLIDIEKIGVDILISGKNNGIRLPLSDEYKMVSEFDINNEQFPGDIAVLYSRI